MSGITSNIDKWIHRSEPDYYIMFIKAWLPFNAWYMINLYSEDDKRIHDRDIIYHIMTHSNKFRDKIIVYLNGTDNESVVFKEQIARLSVLLEKYPLPNVDNQLSFSRVSIMNNPNAKQIGNVKLGKYTFTSRYDDTRPKTSARWILEVVKNSNTQTLGIVELHKCLDSELYNNQYYQSSDNTIKQGLRDSLNAINPDMVSNVKHIKSGINKVPKDCIVMSRNQHVFFIDNTDYVARAIIRVLYELRCKLFHGEIEPSDGYSQIYECAFQIQNILNKSIA